MTNPNTSAGEDELKGTIMVKESTAKAAAPAAEATPEATAVVVKPTQVPKELALYRALLTGNPNYFGNLAASALPPVFPKQSDTTFEEIGCVGFHPQSRRLDAVVFVKQSTGYGGGICTKGSQECVRFYVSFDNGASWVDQGAASVTTYDVPQHGEHQRLEYGVTVPCAPHEKFCLFDNTLLVR